MNKRNYLIIGITILLFAIIIIIILLQKRNNNWATDILESDNYQITMIDCNTREQILDNKALGELSKKWNKLSDNGPWTGDTNKCYTKVTINYDYNGIIREVELLLIDDTSLVLTIGNISEYYTNAKEINSYLYNLFK